MKWLSIVGAAYLGFALVEFADLSITMWEFWAIAVPTIILLIIGNVNA